MDIPEKLATQGTQDEEQKHNAVSVGHHYTQTKTQTIKHTSRGNCHFPSYSISLKQIILNFLPVSMISMIFMKQENITITK